MLFSLVTIIHFFLFFHCLLPRDPDNRKKKEKLTATIVHWMRQPQLLTVWVQNHTATIVFHYLFPCDPDKRKEKEKPQPQLLTVWVLLKRELLLHNIRVWHFRKIVGTRVVLIFVFFSLENSTCLSTSDTFN